MNFLGRFPGSLVLVTALLIGALAWIAVVPETWDFKSSARPVWAFVWAVVLLGPYLFMNGSESVFLYCQFQVSGENPRESELNEGDPWKS
jgi:hypothetical protein